MKYPLLVHEIKKTCKDEKTLAKLDLALDAGSMILIIINTNEGLNACLYFELA